MSVSWSEGKTMTSDGCGSEFRQGCVCVLRTTKGCNRVQARREGGKSKRNWIWALNRGNVVTFH